MKTHRHLKRTTSIVLAVMLILSAFTALPAGAAIVENGETGGCTWSYEDDGTLTISGSGATGDYDWNDPAPWNDESVLSVVAENGVTKIGSHAFYQCADVRYVTLSDSVTEIGDYAFAFTDIIDFEFPAGLTAIGDHAFIYCNRLRAVSIPDGVKTIPEAAFADCAKLSSVTIPDSVTSIGSRAFVRCGSLNEVRIPETVTSIGATAFGYIGQGTNEKLDGFTIKGIKGSAAETYANDNGFTFVAVEDTHIAASGTTGDCSWTLDDNGTLTISGSGAMADYNFSLYEDNDPAPWGFKIKKIVIEDGVTSIGNYAFYYREGLTSVSIPDSVTSIGDCAFAGSDLKSISIPDKVTTIGDAAFWHCEELTDASLGKGVTSIGNSAFSGCTELSGINIPEGVKSIGDSAFYNCKELTSVAIPDGTETIGEYAFKNCTKLADIDFADSITSVGMEAFSNTAWFDGLGDGVVYIGKVLYCYSGVMPADTAIEIEDGTEEVAAYAFSWQTNLKSVKLPDSLKRIGFSAFEMTGLESVVIPDGVTEVDCFAFEYCEQLKNVTIPDSVTKINMGAFTGTGLESVDIPAGVTEIDEYVFRACPNLTSFTVPDNITAIKIGAFEDSGLKSITIPSTVTNIEKNAFNGCDGLVITGAYDSCAIRYAALNNIKFNPTGEFKTGDVSDDGNANGEDAGLLSRYASGWQGYADKIKNMAAADVNKDGYVNGADAGILARYTSGWTQYNHYFE